MGDRYCLPYKLTFNIVMCALLALRDHLSKLLDPCSKFHVLSFSPRPTAIWVHTETCVHISWSRGDIYILAHHSSREHSAVSSISYSRWRCSDRRAQQYAVQSMLPLA